jgi:predicted nuclease of predicted toxin-antitoxin system
VKILLDECVPRPLDQVVAGHECVTPQDRGWAGLTNGELLRRAKGEFDLFITSDQNIRYQQNLGGLQISILQLSTNDLRRIQAAAAAIQKAVASIQRGEFKKLNIP